jgi:hypothetical protein
MLPNGAQVRVAPEKVRDYLLNAENLQNRGKAGRFTQFGFSRAEWQLLSSALERHALENPVSQQAVSEHGTKYVVTCHLATPDGRNPCMNTVWIIEPGHPAPRLVTAY